MTTRIKDEITDVLFAITPLGLKADYNILTQSGTDNAPILLAAAATGKPVYVPPGNYYVNNSQVDRYLENGVFHGPGRLFSGWFGGRNEEQGKMHSVGIATPMRGNVGAGGLLIGGEGESNNGIVLWASSPTGWAAIPKTLGYHEFNLLPNLPLGTGIGRSGTNRVDYTYGSLAYFPEEVQPGDFITHGLSRLKLASQDATGFNVTDLNGVPVSFSADKERAWRWAYDTRRGTCNVAGNVVTFNDGDFFWGYFYSSADNKIKINGTWYSITSITDSRNLTIDTNIGSLSNVVFLQKTHLTFIAGMRTQTLLGGREENAIWCVTDAGEALIGLNGYVDSNVPREMPLLIEGAVSYDGSGNVRNFVYTADGKLGIGESRDNVIASTARVNFTVAHPGAKGGATGAKRIVHRFKVIWAAVASRYLEVYDTDDSNGLKLQSFSDGDTPASLGINPQGGLVGVGGAGVPKEQLHVLSGALRVDGNSASFSTATGALVDYFSGFMRLVATAVAGASNGMSFYTSVNGVASVRAQLSAQGLLSLPGTPTAANDAAAAALTVPVAVGQCYFRTSDGALVKRLT
jgi:hypothetical protein